MPHSGCSLWCGLMKASKYPSDIVWYKKMTDCDIFFSGWIQYPLLPGQLKTVSLEIRIETAFCFVSLHIETAFCFVSLQIETAFCFVFLQISWYILYKLISSVIRWLLKQGPLHGYSFDIIHGSTDVISSVSCSWYTTSWSWISIERGRNTYNVTFYHYEARTRCQIFCRSHYQGIFLKIKYIHGLKNNK